MTERTRPLSAQADRLIRDFHTRADLSDGDARVLRHAISSSRTLARQIDEAITSRVLERIALLEQGVHAVGEYHSHLKTIKLSSSALSRPGMTAFIMGHETQHALNSRSIARVYRAFHGDVRRAALTTHDYTSAVENLIKATRWDESSASLAGWNALVDHARNMHSNLWLGQLVRAMPSEMLTDFIDDTRAVPAIHSDLTVNADLTIDPSAENLESIARRYFDKPAVQTGIGGRGTSDYANYYAAWAVGQAARVHAAVAPGQPMRIDLASLGLSRKLMEESGIDLAGMRQQTYVDESTHPPSREAFHHTIGTFTYVPPAALTENRPNPAREAAQLAATGFALPATEAIRGPTLCGSSSTTQHAAYPVVRRRPSPTAARRPHSERPIP